MHPLFKDKVVNCCEYSDLGDCDSSKYIESDLFPMYFVTALARRRENNMVSYVTVENAGDSLLNGKYVKEDDYFTNQQQRTFNGLRHIYTIEARSEFDGDWVIMSTSNGSENFLWRRPCSSTLLVPPDGLWLPLDGKASLRTPPNVRVH